MLASTMRGRLAPSVAASIRADRFLRSGAILDAIAEFNWDSKAREHELRLLDNDVGDIDLTLAAPVGTGGPLIFDLGDMRTLLFNWTIVQSGMRISDPDALVFDYVQMMMAFLLFNDHPRLIEMIGLGGGSLAKYCYRHLPDTRIVAIEVSAEVIALRRDFDIPEDDERFTVFCADGADHVRIDSDRPDIIMVDGFDERGQPPELCTVVFYQACFDRLQPGGMLVVNLCEQRHAYNGPVARIRRTFGRDVLVAPTEYGGNRLVLARKEGSIFLSKEALSSAAEFLDRCHDTSFAHIAERISAAMTASEKSSRP